jgi:hypothetical protein
MMINGMFETNSENSDRWNGDESGPTLDDLELRSSETWHPVFLEADGDIRTEEMD